MDSWMDRSLDGSIDWQTNKQTIRWMHGRTKTTCLCAAIYHWYATSITEVPQFAQNALNCFIAAIAFAKIRSWNHRTGTLRYKLELTRGHSSRTWQSSQQDLQLGLFSPKSISLQIYVIWWISGTLCFLIFNSSTKAVAESVKRCTTLSSKRSTTKSLGTHPS